MTRRHLTPKEHRMWSRVSKSVRPIENAEAEAASDELVPRETEEPEAPETPKRPHARPKASSEDLEKLIGGFTSPHTAENVRKQTLKQKSSASPADRGKEKRVRRGRVPFGSTLDLHGHTQISGRAVLLQFVAWHRSEGETSVLVITGKGRDGEGVLRRRFLEWISEPDFRTHVSGYARANQKHGGDGAFYLFLKRTHP